MALKDQHAPTAPHRRPRHESSLRLHESPADFRKDELRNQSSPYQPLHRRHLYPTLNPKYPLGLKQKSRRSQRHLSRQISFPHQELQKRGPAHRLSTILPLRNEMEQSRLREDQRGFRELRQSSDQPAPHWILMGQGPQRFAYRRTENRGEVEKESSQPLGSRRDQVSRLLPRTASRGPQTYR